MTSSPIPWSSDSQRNNSHHEAFVPVNSGPIPLAAILSLVIIAYIILVFIGILLAWRCCSPVIDNSSPSLCYACEIVTCCQSTSAPSCSLNPCRFCQDVDCCKGQEEARVCQPCDCCCFQIQFK